MVYVYLFLFFFGGRGCFNRCYVSGCAQLLLTSGQMCGRHNLPHFRFACSWSVMSFSRHSQRAKRRRQKHPFAINDCNSTHFIHKTHVCKHNSPMGCLRCMVGSELGFLFRKPRLFCRPSELASGRGGQIHRALILSVGDGGFKPRSSQTNGLSN